MIEKTLALDPVISTFATEFRRQASKPLSSAAGCAVRHRNGGALKLKEIFVHPSRGLRGRRAQSTARSHCRRDIARHNRCPKQTGTCSRSSRALMDVRARGGEADRCRDPESVSLRSEGVNRHQHART